MKNDLEIAINVATGAHLGQTDKLGDPYILHPLAVMAVVYELQCGDVESMCAAVLHDVVEDTHVTFDVLRSYGFSEEVIKTVDGVTRRDGETYADFIQRSARNPRSALVKWADLTQNLSRNKRLAAFHPEKAESLMKRYTKAQESLLPALRKFFPEVFS